ncbi:YgjV family protein [Aestuariibacter sp. A3R04]|uniref:YgjV family protein n=1 Tax=Aestuariibacter sp. A3R04 TaxID=2841571 RepID=UPI001C0893D1|nr:YgjV family protein [Aestuariibacter sp. A3R04]MBU3020405.1 YgjV family protein [Aestuariibacter sp. A3R04]
MSFEILGQVFGILAFLVAIYSFTHKNDRKLKVSLIVMFSFQTAHFFFLGSITGTIANALNFFRTIISIGSTHRYVGAIFILLNVTWGVANVKGYIDVLPILGASVGTYAIFYASGIKMRKLFICGAVFWLINNIYLGSIGGVLLEITVILANGFTILRLKKGAVNN